MSLQTGGISMLEAITHAKQQIGSVFTSFRIEISDIASQTLQRRLVKADMNIFTFVGIILGSARNVSKNLILWLPQKKILEQLLKNL